VSKSSLKLEVYAPNVFSLCGDVHKKSIVACCLVSAPSGKAYQKRALTAPIHANYWQWEMVQPARRHSWAMESTGEWKPVYNLLEDRFEVLRSQCPPSQTSARTQNRCQRRGWIAQLLSYGLLRGSLIPPLPQRDLRDLTRQRTILVQERARVINRLQKVLEWANIKLASVVSDISGVSARAMLKAMVSGQMKLNWLLSLRTLMPQTTGIRASLARICARPSSLSDCKPSEPHRLSR